jgi:hypothetical protein
MKRSILALAAVLTLALAGCGAPEDDNGMIEEAAENEGQAAAPEQPEYLAAPGCGSGRTRCGGKCVNLSTDSKNCGKCGRRCSSGATCSNKKCVRPKPDAGVRPRPDAGNRG